jgi:hypothetical protein
MPLHEFDLIVVIVLTCLLVGKRKQPEISRLIRRFILDEIWKRLR